MALTTSPVEVRTDGDDNNGGGFNSARGGVDYSQQAAPVLVINDATTAASGQQTITSATGAFFNGLLGNYVQINGAFYEVIAVLSATQINVDRGISPVLAGATLRFGGALATPGKAASVNNSGKAWIRYGIYTTTTTTTNVSGGPIFHNNTTMYYEGYESVRGDRGLKPVLRPHAASMTLCTANASSTTGTFTNLVVDGNGFASITAFVTGNRSYTHECDALNCTTGFNGSAAERCYAYNCSTGFSGGNYLWCVSNNCPTGFSGSNCYECIAISATSAGFTITTNSAVMAVKCVAHACNNGLINASSASRFANCIASNCTNKGFNSNGLKASLIGVAAYNCAANDFPPDFALTATPFVNPNATINSLYDAFAAFALNTTTGGGSTLRGAGLMGYSDIGAVQHQDAGGGATSVGSLFGSSIISAGGRTT